MRLGGVMEGVDNFARASKLVLALVLVIGVAWTDALRSGMDPRGKAVLSLVSLVLFLAITIAEFVRVEGERLKEVDL